MQVSRLKLNAHRPFPKSLPVALSAAPYHGDGIAVDSHHIPADVLIARLLPQNMLPKYSDYINFTPYSIICQADIRLLFSPSVLQSNAASIKHNQYCLFLYATSSGSAPSLP